MKRWSSTKARRVLAALLRIGWKIDRARGSHRTLARAGWANYTFAWHDGVELGPVVLRRIGAKTGLSARDL